MSFRIKVISFILIVSLIPYILIMMFSGNILLKKYTENTYKEMKTQLTLNVERIDQYLINLKRDMIFISQMDIMNDIYSQDIDRRISNLLEKKKKELHLDGDFYVINNKQEIVASSDNQKKFTKLDIKPFFSVDIYSSINNKIIGKIVLKFSLNNIVAFFNNSNQRHYYIIKNKNIVLYKSSNFKNKIDVKKVLSTKPNITIVLEENQELFLNLIKKYEYWFLIVLIFGTIMIGLVAYYVINKLIKPVIDLSTLVQKITKSKNYSQSILVKGHDEVSQLAKAFDAMLHGISKALKDNELLNKEIEDTQKEVVFTMGAIGESRSKETGNHVKRVAEYSKLLALFYGLDKNKVEMLKQASPMHDIGKVAIPDAVLNKPGRFNDEERMIMDTHAQIGYEMLKVSTRPLLKAASIVAYEHHEKWNGSGYPRGLKGEEIHIYGRITALADVFDALGSDRVYKKAWDDDRIFNLFKEERGEHFDPQLIDIFFNNIDKFLEIRDKFKDIE